MGQQPTESWGVGDESPNGENCPRENDFKKLCLIGEGNFSKVFLVREKATGELYAMKVMDKESLISSDLMENVRTERMILELFKHAFMVKMHYAFQNERHLYIVMDFINGGEMYHHLVKKRVLGESRVRFYAREIFLVLEYLHTKNVIYRDLKLENILVDLHGHVVLTDFNISEILNGDEAVSERFCGTSHYVSPEMIKVAKDKEPGYDCRTDWWSFGVLIYELLYGLPPFYDKDSRQVYRNILSKELDFPEIVGHPVSKLAQDFIRKLLNRDPNLRLNAASIRSHPWMKCDWKRMEKKELVPPYLPTLRAGKSDLTYIDTTTATTAEELEVSLEEEDEQSRKFNLLQVDKEGLDVQSASIGSPRSLSPGRPNGVTFKNVHMRIKRNERFRGFTFVRKDRSVKKSLNQRRLLLNWSLLKSKKKRKGYHTDTESYEVCEADDDHTPTNDESTGTWKYLKVKKKKKKKNQASISSSKSVNCVVDLVVKRKCGSPSHPPKLSIKVESPQKRRKKGNVGNQGNTSKSPDEISKYEKRLGQTVMKRRQSADEKRRKKKNLILMADTGEYNQYIRHDHPESDGKRERQRSKSVE